MVDETGRRRPTGEGRRPRAVLVRLTDSEYTQLRVRAARAGVSSLPRFLLESATADSTGMTSTERRELLRQLSEVMVALAKVGANLNQLAHHANTGGLVGEHALATFKEARHVARRISDIFDDVARLTAPFDAGNGGTP